MYIQMITSKSANEKKIKHLTLIYLGSFILMGQRKIRDNSCKVSQWCVILLTSQLATSPHPWLWYKGSLHTDEIIDRYADRIISDIAIYDLAPLGFKVGNTRYHIIYSTILLLRTITVLFHGLYNWYLNPFETL